MSLACLFSVMHLLAALVSVQGGSVSFSFDVCIGRVNAV